MDKATRAANSQHLLNDEVLQNAFDVVSEYHTGVFTGQSASDSEVLEARRNLLALQSVRNQLRSFIADGKIDQKRNQDRVND